MKLTLKLIILTTILFTQNLFGQEDATFKNINYRDNFYYNPKNSSDPFSPIDLNKSKMENSYKKKELRLLEKTSIRNLTFKKIFYISNIKFALIEDRISKETFIIKEGAKIGLHSGSVINISEERIIIQELIFSNNKPATQIRQLKISH